MTHHRNQRITGAALESIMQEVLQGMQDFTGEACIHRDTAAMEILAVERPEPGIHASADIIAFPGTRG
jgi:hypothetical protein